MTRIIHISFNDKKREKKKTKLKIKAHHALNIVQMESEAGTFVVVKEEVCVETKTSRLKLPCRGKKKRKKKFASCLCQMAGEK